MARLPFIFMDPLGHKLFRSTLVADLFIFFILPKYFSSAYCVPGAVQATENVLPEVPAGAA